jgi:hypothetical protein
MSTSITGDHLGLTFDAESHRAVLESGVEQTGTRTPVAAVTVCGGAARGRRR